MVLVIAMATMTFEVMAAVGALTYRHRQMLWFVMRWQNSMPSYFTCTEANRIVKKKKKDSVKMFMVI